MYAGLLVGYSPALWQVSLFGSLVYVAIVCDVRLTNTSKARCLGLINLCHFICLSLMWTFWRLQGIWSPKMIQNPEFFEDLKPYKMNPIVSVRLSSLGVCVAARIALHIIWYVEFPQFSTFFPHTSLTGVTPSCVADVTVVSVVVVSGHLLAS